MPKIARTKHINHNKPTNTFCIETDIEILQLRVKFQTVMVSYSRFIWITNSSYHRRVSFANLLHIKYLLNPIGHKTQLYSLVGLVTTSYIRGSKLKPSCGHWNLWSKQISSTKPSQCKCFALKKSTLPCSLKTITVSRPSTLFRVFLVRIYH